MLPLTFFFEYCRTCRLSRRGGQYQASNTNGLQINENEGPASKIRHELTAPGDQDEYSLVVILYLHANNQYFYAWLSWAAVTETYRHTECILWDISL